ncbi:MAG: hypothetical protein Q8O61_16250 [Nocardioides sp.]|nr:hypothetical protein [Nocardioides sp.]
MSERLKTLMQLEVDRLDVPAPPAASVLAQGRSLRRRRSLTLAGSAVAVLVLVGGGAAVVVGGDDPTKSAPTDAADTAAAPVDTGVTFALGNTVFYDVATKQVQVAATAVKSLYYTSAGVLVRHGNNSWSDGGGPQRFSLVRPDGTVSPVSVETEETVHASDPGQPYVAYAQDAGGTVEVVVHDVDTDTEVARVAVPGAAASFLPVAISGDLVYLGAEMDDFVVDWRTGEITQPGIVSGPPTVAGGRVAISEEGSATVADARTGEELLAVTFSEYGYLTLSPDGRYAMLELDSMDGGGGESEIYDVDTGDHVTLPDAWMTYGWTVDGELFRLTQAGFDTCDPSTGDCSSTKIDLPGRVAEAQLGGRTYES